MVSCFINFVLMKKTYILSIITARARADDAMMGIIMIPPFSIISVMLFSFYFIHAVFDSAQAASGVEDSGAAI
jgi:hypothetical protein